MQSFLTAIFPVSGLLALSFLFSPTFFYFLWPFCYAWLWLHWFCKARLKIPFTLDLLRFAPHYKTFSDSIRSLKIGRALALSTPLFALSFFLPPSLPFWLTLFLVSSFSKWPRKSPAAPLYQWRFPTEISRPLSPDYPLLRKTDGFRGPKQFSIRPLQKPHVLFLFLESFRAKNVGCLGGSPACSPHFDALAETGILFTRFHANGPQTFRALIASLFGIPAHLDTMSLHPFCSVPLIGLPQILKNHGYHPALIQGCHTAFDWTFPFLRKHGFETIVGREQLHDQRATSWGVTDAVLFDYAAEWLAQQKEPTFLSLFTISNHHPWDSPLPFPTPAELPEPYRRYLQTFAYSDHCLGQFIERLKKSGLLDQSLVFILGDHGQEIGHPIPNSLHADNLHVPLLILGGPKVRIDAPASQVDLLPTVLDLLNLPAIHHSVGKSLLREGASSVFFSSPSEIGLLDGAQAEARSYFQAIEALYARSAWVPAAWQQTAFELKCPPRATDAQWLSFQREKGASPILDLSDCPSLTDAALLKLDPRKAASLHELKLFNSPLFTDRSLQWIAAHCPNLSILAAAHCPLFTSEGIAAVLNQCPLLRSLNLEGNDERIAPTLDRPLPLQALHLKDCFNASLAHFIPFCPHLNYLVAPGTDPDLLAQHLDQLLYLWLENGPSVADASLAALLRANPSLSILILEHFPDIQTVDLSAHRSLILLKFAHCPTLSDETLLSLQHLPLQNLALIACPQITPKGLAALPPTCTLLIDACPGIPKAALHALRDQGLKVY